jgi:uroporphyrinogen-III synthase/uroporphyrinogen III methyltransferase/synthase
MNAPTLAGRRILVTRAAHQSSKLSEGLRALGAEPVEVPVLEILPPESFELLDAALRQLSSYNWLLLTSANAVRVLAERASFLGIGLETTTSPQVAAIGKATASAAKMAGLTVTFIPDNYVAESLVDGLQTTIKNHTLRQRFLLVRAAVARDMIPDALRALGAAVDVVEAYQNAMPKAAPEQLRQALAEGLDAVTFTSSSSVTHLADAARTVGIEWPFAGVPAVSIGPITSQTLHRLGWPPTIEANPSDILGLIAAVERILQHGDANPGDDSWR